MEALDAPLFDHILAFVEPEDACKIAMGSKTLKGLVDNSLLWRTWCEKDSPSLRTSPAKELVTAWYGNREQGYKALFPKLTMIRSGRSVTAAKSCSCGAFSGFAGYVMLMDVHVRGTAVLSCSATCTAFERECQDSLEEWETRRVSSSECKAVVKGDFMTDIKAEDDQKEDLSSTLKELAQNILDEYEHVPRELRFHLKSHDTVSFSWKLMRIADGKVHVLLDREMVNVRDSGSCPIETICQPDKDGRFISRFEASAPLRLGDAPGNVWKMFRPMMRLLCFERELSVEGSEGGKTRTEFEGLSIEVGVARDSHYGHFDTYCPFLYVEKEDLLNILERVLGRWF